MYKYKIKNRPLMDGWVDVEIIFTGKSLTLTTSQSSVTVDILG